MSALSTAAALPFVPTPAIAQDVLAEPDREVVDLAARILALLPAYNAASEATCAADDQYLEQEPEVPDVMLWRATDPVRWNGEVWRDGKRYLTCDLAHIAHRQAFPRLSWTFIGNDDEFEKAHQDDFDDDGYPSSRLAHLWEGRESKRDAERMRELVAAKDEYQAKCDSLRRELHCEALLEAFECISAEMGDLVQRLSMLRACSLPALRAKAAVYAQHLHAGYQHDSSACDDQFELLASIVDDLRGQGVPASGRLALAAS